MTDRLFAFSTRVVFLRAADLFAFGDLAIRLQTRCSESMYTQAEIEDLRIQKLDGLLNHKFRSQDRLWDHFPRGRGKLAAPEVTTFCNEVTEFFEVILSERDWENPSVQTLAKKILNKRNHPEKMLQAFEDDERAIRQGRLATFGFLALISKLEKRRRAVEKKVYLNLKKRLLQSESS